MSLYDPNSDKDLDSLIGFHCENSQNDLSAQLVEYVNLKLAARGLPISGDAKHSPMLTLGASLIANMRERYRHLDKQLCPADRVIQSFLNDYLKNVLVENQDLPWVPAGSLVLERHGLARTLSLPRDKDEFSSKILKSYRVHQGVCHNPTKDRRTTKGVFHIVEGGYAVTADKKEVPKQTFALLLQNALTPPEELLRLPFTSTQQEEAAVFASILLRPVVCPEIPGVSEEKSIEVRFFAPGSLVANLDFVESIFGNAGDPFLPENDARIDVKHWSGHTGCVILAPHLITLKKKDLGLPHVSDASERQKRDGMCWEDENELYNDGGAFKVTCRDHRGIVVTLIADNYFGYCKKEVKSQLSYAANLMGMCEEEHAGGAIAFPRVDLGESFELSTFRQETDHTFEEVVEQFGDLMNLDERGFAIDKSYPDIYYVPENVKFNLRKQTISWDRAGKIESIELQPNRTYMLPSGYNVEMEKPDQGTVWRLVGTFAEGTLCHKPCTVSGGGKSEISKPITDSMITGPILTYNYAEDFDLVEFIINRDYAGRYKNPTLPIKQSRKLLSEERSLGSVVRLLTPSPEFTDEYNSWLSRIPRHVRDLVLVVKRFYSSDWGSNWRSRFNVDTVNGLPGHELKYGKRKLVSFYSRVGFDAKGSWRTFGLRRDFYASRKLQMEDDITASLVVPAKALQHLHPDLTQPSFKFVHNCEYRLFQRPDEAIVRGYDKTAEADFSAKGNFFSNYEPLPRAEAKRMIADAIMFDEFSEPIRNVIHEVAQSDSPDYFVSTSNPRLVNNKPSKNPRYLQNRPDLSATRTTYVAKLGARLNRRVPLDEAVLFPVTSVLPGRRNNPANHEVGIRPLAVYNPIHYQELPELFMEFISSLTGKSPSTTGAGSEGALTKGPFNCMPLIIDLNNALVSYLVTGNSCFTSSAGYIGPNYRVDHDISLLIPEVWSRMFVHEREPEYLIESDFLDKIEDFEHDGKKVLASRLGYRVNKKFVLNFFGRMFSDPSTLFNDEMLKPELQSIEDYVDGINNIVETQQRIALSYFEDETIELACPPLKALLHIMAYGEFEGKDCHDPEIRAMFNLNYLRSTDWYKDRLATQQENDKQLCSRQIAYLEKLIADEKFEEEAERLDLTGRLNGLQTRLAEIESPDYLQQLEGTIGTDPAILNAVCALS